MFNQIPVLLCIHFTLIQRFKFSDFIIILTSNLCGCVANRRYKISGNLCHIPVERQPQCAKLTHFGIHSEWSKPTKPRQNAKIEVTQGGPSASFSRIFRLNNSQDQSRLNPHGYSTRKNPKILKRRVLIAFFFGSRGKFLLSCSPLGPGRFLTSCPAQYVQISEKIDPFEPPWSIWVSSTFKSVVFARCWLFRGKSCISNTLKR